MLSELHIAGFQRLRAMPYLAGTGAWRCEIAPASVFHRNHGGLLWNPAFYHSGNDVAPRELMDVSAKYTSASALDGSYFDWDDASKDDARTLAAKFVNRFASLCRLGEGWDHEYAGWFLRAVGLAERGWMMSMFDEYSPPSLAGVGLLDVRPEVWKQGETERPLLPLPPPGELQQDRIL